MRKILKNRLALSTVVTTLIILVVSVLLAGVVTYFAINVVSTRVQQESLQLTFTHVWVDSNGNSQAALLVKNTGGRDVVINAIQVRGIAGTLGTNVYYNAASTDPAALIAGVAGPPATGLLAITKSTANIPITLASGSAIQIYINHPNSVGINDIGTTIGITVLTANAMYYQETNVQGTGTSLA
jgi:hypothetical protein